jgi:hypothetical protein
MFETIVFAVWFAVMYLPFGTTLMWGKYGWEKHGN